MSAQPTQPIPVADGAGPVGWRALDAGSVLLGAGLYVLITLPTGIIASALAGDNDSSNWLLVAALVIAFVAPIVSGGVAARHHRANPLTHGAVATAIGWLVVAAVSVIAKLARGDDVPVLTLLLLGCVDVSVAVVSAYATFRRELRATEPRPES